MRSLVYVIEMKVSEDENLAGCFKQNGMSKQNQEDRKSKNMIPLSISAGVSRPIRLNQSLLRSTGTIQRV